MLSSDTRVMGRFVDVVWYVLNGTPERGWGIPTIVLQIGSMALCFVVVLILLNTISGRPWCSLS